MPVRPELHQATTWYLCSFSIQYSSSDFVLKSRLQLQQLTRMGMSRPHDSVPGDPSNLWPRSRLFVIPITWPGATICPILEGVNARTLRLKCHRQLPLLSGARGAFVLQSASVCTKKAQ